MSWRGGDEKTSGSSCRDAGEFASLCSEWAGVMASRPGTASGGEGEARRSRVDGEVYCCTLHVRDFYNAMDVSRLVWFSVYEQGDKHAP
jgi:hypothetical protein